MTLRSQKILAWVATFFFVGSMALYVLEFKYFHNTLGMGGLVKKSLLAGLVFGLGVGWYFHQKSDSKEAVPIIRRWLFCLAIPVLFSPLIGSLLNRGLSRGEHTVQAKFIDEKAFASSPFGFLEEEKIRAEGFYLFVFLEGEIQQFELKKSRFQNAKKGEQISLKLRKGGLGHDYLAE